MCKYYQAVVLSFFAVSSETSGIVAVSGDKDIYYGISFEDQITNSVFVFSMAHVHAFGQVAPAAAGIIHYGATS